MATFGTYDLNLTSMGNTVNNSTKLANEVVAELANQGSLIGLAIAISIALTLIFGAIFIVINFIPALIGKIKGIGKV